MDFGQLGAINGDLVVDTANQVSTLTGNSIANITGQFKLNNLTSLFTLNMQGLRGVGRDSQGGILWQGLPLLQSLNFGPGLDSASSINIQNTQIQDLSSVNVKIANQVQVSNNPALSAVNWGTTNCTNLTITGNGLATNGANITLNSLEGVSSLSIRNASGLALPALETCQFLLAVESGGIESLMFPNLTTVGGIAVSNSPSLTNVSFPELQSSTGGLKLINNDHLGGDLIFPQLTQVRGDLNITGSFDSVQMPKLNTIQGTSYLWSTQDIGSTCGQFGPKGSYAGTKIVGGVTCHGNSVSASAAGGTGTNGGANAATSSGAAVPGTIAQPASLFGAAGLLAALLGAM